MKKVLIIVFIVFSISSIFAEWINLGGTDTDLVTFEQSRNGNLKLEFVLDGFERESIVVQNETFSRISYPESGRLLETGMPDLPVFTRLIAVPQKGNITINTNPLHSQLIEDIIVYPQKEYLNETESALKMFSIKSDFYQSDNLYPSHIVISDEPAVMRDIRLIKLTFCPFQFHPGKQELVIHDHIEVEVNVNSRPGINEKKHPRPFSRNFQKLYSSLILNYDQMDGLREEFGRESILIIYPDNSTVEDNLEYLIDWKRQKGFEVNAVNTSETGYSNYQIKNYIQNAYDNWENPPEYVILVGDVNGSYSLPAWYEPYSGGSGIGDHPYSQLEGDDVLADLMLGRLSFNNISELQTIIAKIINYESSPYLENTDWYEKGIMYAFGGPAKIATCETVEQYISHHNPEFSFEEIYYSNWVFSLDQALNAGASCLCWRSQGVDCGWSGNNINALNNGWMLPFAMLSTCYTGDFNGNALSEIFLKAGTPSMPRGGIAAFGTSTGLTSGCFNNCMTNGVFYGIYIDEIFSAGGALLRGKLNLYQQYPDNPFNHVDCWSHCNNLFGDPSLEFWTAVPESILVDYPSQIAAGTNYLEINVTNSDYSALENAWITVRGTDYLQSGYTNSSGLFVLDLSPVLPGCEYEVTITRHNKIPSEGSFSVYEADQNPVIAEINYLDESGDGIPNPGEAINLELHLENWGILEVTDLEAELVSQSNLVEVTDSVAFIGSLAGGEQTVNSELAIHINPATPGGYAANLKLYLRSGEMEWQIPVFIGISGPILDIQGIQLLNSSEIMPGEDTHICFEIINTGQISADDLSMELHCDDYNLSVVSGSAFLGSIEPGESISNSSEPFLITVLPQTIPGSQIPVTLHLSSEAGLEADLQYLLEIGNITQEAPLGPDAYGYYCYDDGDTLYENCPVYDWIEINSTGNNLNIYSEGDFADITDLDLPADFTFVFYGIEYDLITVSTSGWICPGGSQSADFMNWIVPGPGGPSPIIAAFWDDLHNGSGNVFSYYDQSEHLFIIEWFEMRNENMNQIETFEIILYDPNYYTTISGDSKIKIQYKDFDNANVGAYPYHGADHGLYCTIGLEDPSGKRGLQYSYNNTYPTAAKPLTDESAILFTVSSVPGSEPYINLADLQIISGDDEFLECGEEAVLNLNLRNIGGAAASNISVQLICSDSYIDITQAQTTAQNLESGETVWTDNPLIMQISPDMPDYHSFFINFLINSDEGTWQSSYSLTAYEPNTFAVFPDSIIYEINWGESASSSFELQNIGDVPVNYSITLEETGHSRDVTGAFLTFDTDSFMPGESAVWNFSLVNESEDGEWIKDLWISFPDGVEVISATNLIGGSGGEMLWDGSTGNEAVVNWHGASANDWGYLHNGETAAGTVSVNLGSEFVNDMTISYIIGGDGYGNEPHQIEGEIILEYPLRWIGLDTAGGFIYPDSPHQITIEFDTSSVEETTHSCHIIIKSSSWDTKTIPVTLRPAGNDNDNDPLPPVYSLDQNYPNPFNPQTIIPYSISKTGKVVLAVYNLKGQLVKTLVNDSLIPGNYQAVFNAVDEQGKAAASGVYLYRMELDDQFQVRKMILIK